MDANCIRIESQGPPEVLKLGRVKLGKPGPDEVLIRQTAIGVNYIDVYFRNGTYAAKPPAGVGTEAAGVVETVGSNVRGFAPGDRVAYAGAPQGSYADFRIMPAQRIVKVPDGVTDEIAAAVLMKGMTVEYLLNRCVHIARGRDVLFYAAAGGVGLLAGQWGNHLGSRMIGVTTGASKIALARANGYSDVVDRADGRIAEQVRALTQGRGVFAAYDSAGKATFDETLNSIAPRGYFVSFGATTGSAPPMEAGRLLKGGSLYYTRPTLATYIASQEELLASAAAVFELVMAKVLNPVIGKRFPLAEAAQAHRELEAAMTSGSTILLP